MSMTKKHVTALVVSILLLNIDAVGQLQSISGPQVTKLIYHGTTTPLGNYSEDPKALNEVTREELLGYHAKSDWPLHLKVNPNAQPNGLDPALQKRYNTNEGLRAVIQSYDGIGYSSVNPPDPTMDVSAIHVIQMVNGSSGAYFKIWDKNNGSVLVDQTYFDNYLGLPGGKGDPIVLYDQMADRWLMSEFAATGNHLHIAISETNDPLGAWHTYIFTTPDFPDYPKFAVWPDAYYVTTNEDDPSVYALDRTKMLAGDATATSQRFTMPQVPTIGFQSATPVDFDGATSPPEGTPGYIMRMVDDGWSVNINEDYLEIWQFDVDWDTPANSTLSGPDTMHTQSFDTDLCGFQSFACIEQPNSTTNLDPLREVLMNRIHYRNFGTHESIVCTHVTDVDNTDHAGVRWYELRKTSDWSIYQQGTYSPDTDSRWMASIAINDDGAIGLAYNVASESTFPSLRYTGRRICDPPGTMSEMETSIVEGSSHNGSNRYGDYAQMSIDPVTGFFWFTGEYNTSTQWSTRIASFDLMSCFPTVAFASITTNTAESDADIDNNCLDYKEYPVVVRISMPPSQPATLTFNDSGTALEGNTNDFWYDPSPVILTALNPEDTIIVRVYDDGYVEDTESIQLSFSLNANGGDAVIGSSNQIHTLTIQDNDTDPLSQINGNPINADFESDTDGFTSINTGGGDLWTLNSETGASSSNWTVPDNGSAQLFFVNDDACNCNMLDVKLITPTIDLTNSSSCSLSFDSYFLGRRFHGKEETAQVYISINSDPYILLPDAIVPTVDSWQNVIVDLAAYDGEESVSIAFGYNDDGGYLYGWAVDNVVLSCTQTLQVQTSVNTGNSDHQYLGPNSTVHFSDPASGNFVASIQNMSDSDFGCTSVEVDRAGNSALPFNSYNAARHLHSKTFIVNPQYDVTGDYNLTMYFTTSEMNGWENTTGSTAMDGRLVKVSDTTINTVSPGNVEDYIIIESEITLDTLGEAIALTSSFSGGFSGFGFGNYCNLLVRSNSDSNDGSLRQSLACSMDGDTIDFASSLIDEISITSAPLIINHNIYIRDNPITPHIVEAANTIRAFEVMDGVQATIEGLTIKSGTAENGRGILNHGLLNILNVRIENHTSAGPGEVLTNLGTLDIEGDCTIEK